MARAGRRVEVFAEMACPFTHAGLQRFVAERERRAASEPLLIVRAWALEYVNRKPLDPAKVAEEIAAMRESVAPDLFHGFDTNAVPTTSIPAFGLVAAAYRVSPEVGEEMSIALRWALFEQGLDIADDAVLEEIGARFAVKPLSIEAAIAAADADLVMGRAKGVQGSPHFFVGDHDWFCPSLDISHDAGGFTIRRDGAALDEFYATIFED